MHQLKGDGAENGGKIELYDRFAATIMAYLCQLVANRQDAEDLLLEVFMAALNNKAFLEFPEERQLAWLRRVARNKVVDCYRHSTRLSFVSIEHAAEVEDRELTPEQRIEQKERYERLSQVFNQLSPLQKHLLQLRYGRDLRLTHIAELFGKSEGTVRKLLSRTLQKMRQLYEQTEKGA